MSNDQIIARMRKTVTAADALIAESASYDADKLTRFHAALKAKHGADVEGVDDVPVVMTVGEIRALLASLEQVVDLERLKPGAWVATRHKDDPLPVSRPVPKLTASAS